MSRFFPALLGLSALAACASAGGHGVDAANGGAPAAAPANAEARAAIGRQDILTQMTFWAGEYQAAPDDIDVARNFAEALRKGGRYDRSAQVAMQALQRHDGDAALFTTLGRSLIASGKAQDALRPLALVAQAEQQNWQVRSALGVALDQLERFAEARQAYQEALAIAPDEPAVLTNLGVSYLLSGAPADAETYLRRATAAPNAPVEARQNLAISLALQGRFDEAEQIERIDLPPQMAANNMDYLRGLVSDPRRWGDLGRARQQ